MPQSIEIIIEGKPTAWTPSRVMKAGYAYNPKGKEKSIARSQVKSQYKQEPIPGPVYVTIMCYMTIPSSSSKKSVKSMLNGEIKHVKKPDLDNVIKFSLDAVKGIVIADDNQIWSLTAQKMYSDNPRTVITIYSDES